MNYRLLLLGLTGLLVACGEQAATPDKEPGLSVAKVSVTGELRSANSRFFGPPAISDMWHYTISYLAPEGSIVTAGTPILSFDTQELRTKLRDKRNELNQKQKEREKQQIVRRERLAELKLQQEEAKASRDKNALKADIPQELLAERDYRENQINWQKSKIALQQAQSNLRLEEVIQQTEIQILDREIGVLQTEIEQLDSSVSAMNIKAPGDGVVIHATDRRQKKLTVGDSVWMGRRAIELPDLSELELLIEIPERESARVQVGQPVQFALDAAPEQLFRGKIVELASVFHARSRNQPAKVFDAVVDLENADSELMRPGMSVNADIFIGGRDAAQ
jgi:multidrug efflux pump subunit AcrA (membrane-fusion protein)